MDIITKFTMVEPIFKIEKVSKSFLGHQVLKNISLDVMPGEIIGIIGSSGSGKTTFLNTIVGFIRPDNGDVKFRLNHLLTYKNNAIYRSVYDKQSVVKTVYGFASQIPSFYEELTTKENLNYFGVLHNLSKDAINANSETLLSLMSLQQSTNIQSKNLSGGMKRRLDIACSLIHDPEVLLLDEPTSDLDPINRNHIWSLIKKINAKGTTIILSSHHLNELEEICDRIAIIKDGEIIAIDDPDALKKQFIKQQEIIFKTSPGKYENLTKDIPNKYVIDLKIKDKNIHIHTKDVEKVLMDILEAVKRNDEKLKSIRVVGESLDDVFINILKDDHSNNK
jgi:ABC-2 type transport system ATP-binding protein